MKPMFAKELRENAKWAILGLVVLSAALIFAAANPLEDDKLSRFWHAVWLVTAFGGPLLGASLGRRQILPELRRDLWAFLIHRPATRGQLWAGKTAAGLTLYALMTTLPLLGAGIWAATPGNLPGPFDIRLLLPGIVSILTGVAFYFGGMLTALRPAHRWGSRMMGLPAALVGSVWTAICTEFWTATVIALTFALVTGLAARSSFLTTGEYERQPRAGKFALAVTLYVGIVVTLFITASLGLMAEETLHARASLLRYTQYELGKTGDVLRVTRDNDTILAATDLAGRPVVLPPNASAYDSGEFLQPRMLLWTDQSDPTRYNDMERFILPPQNDGKTLWYFVRNRRQIVGYSPNSRLPVGVLGPRGLTTPNQSGAAGRFPDGVLRNSSTYFYLFPRSIFWADVRAGTTGTLLTVNSPDAVRGLITLSPSASLRTPEAKNHLAVATQKTIQLFPETGGRPLFVISPGIDLTRFPIVQAAQTKDGGHFLFWHQTSLGTRDASLLTEFDAGGRLVRRLELPPLPDSRFQTPAAFGLIGAIVPPAGTFLVAVHDNLTQQPANVWINTSRDGPTALTAAMLSLVSSLLSAALAFLVGRRCVFSKFGLWAWTIGVFWLGPPGVLLLLSLRAFPAREICPNCRRPRVVTRALCEHCDAPFPPPAPDGTEIFEDDSRPLQQSEAAAQGAGQ